VVNLARCQALQGHEVSIYSVTAKPPIAIHGVAVRHFHKDCYSFFTSRGLAHAISSHRPDVVHFHSVYIPDHALVAFHLRRERIPYVVTPNGGCSPLVLKKRAFLKVPYKLLIEKPFLNGAAFVHSVGDTQSIRHYGVSVPIVFAPNGFSHNEVPAVTLLQNPILAARPSWANRVVFLYLGRLAIDQKGLDILLKGFSQATRTRPQCSLVLVGPDWHGSRHRLEVLSRELGVHNDVLFVGQASGASKFAYLSAADCFIHPSRWEGMPFAVSEALACGKPCLLSEAADPCGFVSQYGAGLVMDASVASVSQSIVALTDMSSHERKVMSRQAKTLVASELSWNSIAAKLTQAYSKYAVRGDAS
jgi:glycosyltransferase involved in cell wall biosynthesis